MTHLSQHPSLDVAQGHTFSFLKILFDDLIHGWFCTCTPSLGCVSLQLQRQKGRYSGVQQSKGKALHF